jgi:amino acid permease
LTFPLAAAVAVGVVEVVIELAFVALVTGLAMVVVIAAKNSYQKPKTYFKTLRDYLAAPGRHCEYHGLE